MIVSNCTVEAFFEHLRHTGKKIVCYGAGAAIVAYFGNFKDYHMEDHTLFVCDSSQSKWGTTIKLEGKNFDVCAPEAMFALNPAEFVILITCWNTVSVIEGLEKYPQLADVECFSANIIQISPDQDLAGDWQKVAENPAFYDYQNMLKKLNLKDKHKGERCFIIGNGPSLRAEDLNKINGEVSIAFNYISDIFDQTAWRPTYFLSGDSIAYYIDGKRFSQVEAQYRFLSKNLADLYSRIHDNVHYYNLRGLVTEKEFSENIVQEMYMGYGGILYTGLQLAAYMGFSKIYLIGVDHRFSKEGTSETEVICNEGLKDHFYEETDLDSTYSRDYEMCQMLYGEEAQRAARSDMRDENMKTAKQVCDAKGIKIYNATRGGYLEVFPRVDFDDLF